MRGNCLKGRRAWSRNVLALAVASCFAGELAYANPTAPTVKHGQATFATQGNVLAVTNAPGTVINWQSFSIASQEITKFIQQSSASAVLNRVIGVNPSAILGQLQSNGRVFLINSNGIGIGPNATIDVAGFVASTLNISDGDFIAGRHRFTETPGAGAASVINQGKITTPAGGMVYLVGQNIENHGIIKTPGGEIMLAAGKSIELVDAQTPEVRVQITAPEGQALNLGQLIASGGRIGMYAGLVRHGGVANANTAVVGENGKIVFKAVKDVTLEKGSVTTASGPTAGTVKIEAQTGTATVAGTVEANATAARGGTIEVTAAQGVAIEPTARISADGIEGGRIAFNSANDAVRVSGHVSADASAGRGGQVVIAAATQASIAAGARVTASGTQGGGSVEIRATGAATGPTVSVESAAPASEATGEQGAVEVSGTIAVDGGEAQGGAITLNARSNATLGDTGVLSAIGAGGGAVHVEARDTTLVSGVVDASGKRGPGGKILLLAPRVGLVRSARLDVSGLTGGGIALVGGDFQGMNPDVQNAWRTYFGPGATINADAIEEGDGGKVIVWANDWTRYFGSISARGGAKGGDGGFAEISGKQFLTFDGRVDLGAPRGKSGTLLLDPNNIIIAAGGVATLALAGDTPAPNDILEFAEGGGTGSDQTISAAALTLIMNAGTSVELQAHTDITVNEAILPTGAGGLTLRAGDDVFVNQPITLVGAGALSIIAGDAAGTPTGVNADAGRNITIAAAGVITTATGDVTLNARDAVAVNGAINAGSGKVLISANQNGAGSEGFSTSATIQTTSTAADAISIKVNESTTNTGTGGAAIGGDILAGAGTITIDTANGGTTGGSITQSAGTLTANAVNLTAGGGIGTAGNPVRTSTESLTATSGANTDIFITETDGLIALNLNAGAGNVTLVVSAGAVADADGAVDITATTANVSAQTGIGSAGSANSINTAVTTIAASNSTNNVNIVDADSVSVSGSNAGGEFNVTAVGAGNTLTVNASAITAGSVILQADEMTLTGTVTGTNAVTLRPNTANTVITLGNGAAGLNLSDAALDQVVVTSGAGVLTIGADTSQAPVPAAGSITIDAPISAPAGWNRLSLRTGGAIIDGNAPAGPDLTVTHLALRAAMGIGAGLGNPLETAVTNLAFTNTAAGGVSIANTGALTITSVDGIATSNGGSAAAFVTAGSPLTVAMDIIQTGAINLTANENPTPVAGDTLTVNTAVTVRSTGGNVTLSAGDNIVLSGTALVESIAGAGVATLLAGASNNDGATGGSISGAGTVGATSVLLDAFGAIGSAGNSIHTNAGTLAAQTSASATGGIFVTEANDLVIGTVSAVTGVTARNNGAIDIRTTAGDITLTNNVRAENAVGAAGAGGARLEAGGGAGFDLIAGAGRVTTGGGIVDLRGDAVGTLAAPIRTDIGTGSLTATSGAGDIAVSNNSAAGLNTNQLTGFNTATAQTVRVTQTAGDITVGGSVNVGGDTLELVANAVAGQDIIGGAGTLTAASLRLDASGGIGGGSAVRTATATSTTGTLTLTSAGTNAAGDITVVEANALDTTRVALTTGGTAQAVSLASTAGPLTLGADIGTTVDDLTLITTNGNIVGGAGAAIANNLMLNAAGGIGTGTAVNTYTAGDLTLTTSGNGLLGSITVVEANALNTNTVTINTHGTTQTVSLTAPSITIGNAFGTANDNLTLVASAGSITGTPTITGIDVVLDAATGVGTGTGPGQRVEVTATNLAARSRTTGGVFVSEINGVSLRTLSGVSNQAPNGFNYDLIAAGALALDGSVSVNGVGNVLLTTTTGNITVNTGAATVGGANNHVFIDSTGAIIYGTGSVTANTLALRSQAGGIGTAGTPLVVAAANLEAVATGGIFASDMAGGLTIGGATLGGFAGVSTVSGSAAIAVTATNGALTITDQVVADGTGSVTLTTTGAGNNVALNAGGAVGSVDNHVFLDAGGAITQAAGSVTASTLALRSGAGDIGASGTPLVMAANNLEARATGGGVFVNDTAGGLTIGGAVLGGLAGVSTASVNGNIAVTATGGVLAVTDQVVANGTGSVTLKTTGVNDIQLNAGAVGSATNHVYLDAGGTTTQAAGTVTANTLAIRSGAGSIGSSITPFLVAASNLEAQAPGGIFVRDTGGGLTLGGATLGGLTGVSTTAGNAEIEVTATNGALTITEQVVANGTGNVELTTTGVNSIALNAGTVGSAANHVFLDAGGGIAQTAGSVTANTLALRAGAGNIGTGVALLNVAASNLEAQATGGGVFVNDTAGGLTIGGAVLGNLTGLTTTSVNGNVAVTATGGALTVTDQVMANGTGNVTLTTTGANNIALNAGAVVGSPANSVFLDAGGTTTQAGGTVTANTLAMRSGAGSIGSVGTPLVVTANNLEAQATGGGVFITDTAGGLAVGGATLGGLTGVSTASGGAGIAVTATSGSLTLTEAVTANGAGSVTLTATGGGSNVVLDANVMTAGTVQVDSPGTITGNGLLSAGTADLNAGTGIGHLSMAAAIITAYTGTGAIDLDNALAGPVTVNSLTTNAGAITFDQAGGGAVTFAGDVTTNNGGITLTNAGAGITIGAAGVVRKMAGAAPLAITATGASGSITNLGQVSNNNTATAVDLTADDMSLAAGTIAAGSGPVKLTSSTPGQAIAIGAGGSGLGLSAADINSVTTTGPLTIGDIAHTGTIATDGNVAFTSPSGVVTLQTSGGDITVGHQVEVANDFTLDTRGGGAGAGAIIGTAGGLLKVTGNNDLVLNAGAGIGSLASPLQTEVVWTFDGPAGNAINVVNSNNGDVVIRNSGNTRLAGNFRNQAPGELRLITVDGSIDTGAINVHSAGGRIALIANDTGTGGHIAVGGGGITSNGGAVVLHAADNIVVNGNITSGGGAVRMMAGTSASGINAGHATFGGVNPALAAETAADDDGSIFLNAMTDAGAGNIVLIAATTSAVVPPTSIGGVTQSAGGALRTDADLTVVTLRGTGGLDNGGASIILNAAPNNKAGTINVFACAIDGCPGDSSAGPPFFLNPGTPPAPFVTAPFINSIAKPALPPTPGGFYADGAIVYSAEDGTNISGFGTVNDFTFFTPGSVTFSAVPLATRNLRIEATQDINISLTGPVQNADINGGRTGGSIQFVAGNDINYHAAGAGNTIGLPTASFNHNLSFIAAGDVMFDNAIYMGPSTLTVAANGQPILATAGMLLPPGVNPGDTVRGVLLNSNLLLPATGSGSVFMQGNHTVQTGGNAMLSGVNLTVQGGDLGSLNQASNKIGQQLEVGGTLDVHVSGNFRILAAPSGGTSGNAAIVRADVVTATVGGEMEIKGASATGGAPAGVGHNAGAAILQNTGKFKELTLDVVGPIKLTGGTPTGARTGAAAELLSAGTMKISTGGGLELTGGSGNIGLDGTSQPAIPGIFQLLGSSTLFDVQGFPYPIDIDGSIRIFVNNSLAPALLLSGAPPLNLDPLLAESLKALDCAVFSGGACVIKFTVADAGDATKGQGLGVCK